jgi:hypothetical protein
MSLEIDLLNTYPVCGHEPNGDSHVRPPLQRAGSRLTWVGTKAIESPPTRPIASADSRRIYGPHSSDRGGPMVPR